MSTQASQITQHARKDRNHQFLSMAQLLTPAALLRGFRRVRKKASGGVDGVTAKEYQRNLGENVKNLHDRLKKRRYRSQPLRRTYIPKADGKRRPLSIPCVEDKVVQNAVIEVIQPIYEGTFLDCSFGFRPGRGQHDALARLGEYLHRSVSFVLEADICAYFDSIVRSKLMEMIERRIKDESILRLISKWMNAGILEDGKLLVTKTGTGQGQPISPLLANIYLHYVLDTWFEEEIKPRLQGGAHLVRYADDFVLCFQYRNDARFMYEQLKLRFAEYGLQLHSEKTRVMAFGRFAWMDDSLKRLNRKKPETFNFLGFTFACSKSFRGKFLVRMRTIGKRLAKGLKATAQWLKANMHARTREQWAMLNLKLTGHYNYYGVPTNRPAMEKFYRVVVRLWKRTLNRRSRKRDMNWDKMNRILEHFPLTRPYLINWPPQGSTPEEPSAGIPHARVCEGEGPDHHGEPKRARSRKRPTQPRGHLQ